MDCLAVEVDEAIDMVAGAIKFGWSWPRAVRRKTGDEDKAGVPDTAFWRLFLDDETEFVGLTNCADCVKRFGLGFFAGVFL